MTLSTKSFGKLDAFAIVVLGCMTVTGCSRESPIAPEASPADVSTQNRAAPQTAAPGTYEILFLKETRQGLQTVVDFTLNVREFLVLKSQITDSNGVPAQEGTVTYEYCERQNVKVPSAECESGAGRWKRHMSMSVDPVGSLAGFGSCSTPRTIGFRFRFDGLNGPIASGVSAARDVSWE